MAWSSVTLPTVLGQHVVATKGDTAYRIACAGSGRWTVSALNDVRRVSGTLELTAEVYTYSVLGSRAVAGADWRNLLA